MSNYFVINGKTGMIAAHATSERMAKEAMEQCLADDPSGAFHVAPDLSDDNDWFDNHCQ